MLKPCVEETEKTENKCRTLNCLNLNTYYNKRTNKFLRIYIEIKLKIELQIIKLQCSTTVMEGEGIHAQLMYREAATQKSQNVFS